MEKLLKEIQFHIMCLSDGTIDKDDFACAVEQVWERYYYNVL